MNGTEAWERFRSSGKIEDYLAYSARNKAPKVSTAEMVAMGNVAELSGIGDANMVSMNNMATLAKVDEETIE